MLLQVLKLTPKRKTVGQLMEMMETNTFSFFTWTFVEIT